MREHARAAASIVADRMADLEAIRSLKARYCRFIDTKQWDALPSLFAPDARFEGFGSAPSGADVATFVQGVSARLGPCISIHHCHMPEIVFRDAHTARGIWAMMDYLEWPEGFSPKEAAGSRGFYGYGHYEEEYRRLAGGWVIGFMRLTRLRIDALAADHPAPLKGMLAASPGWLER